MGEAQKNAARRAAMVEVDLTKPLYALSTGERATGQAAIHARISRVTIAGILKAAYPQGANLADRRQAAIWQEAVIESEDDAPFSLPFGTVDWLVRIFKREDLKVDVQLAHASLALLSYLETLDPDVAE